MISIKRWGKVTFVEPPNVDEKQSRHFPNDKNVHIIPETRQGQVLVSDMKNNKE